jgi:chromosome segregation ATPase
MNWIAFFVQMLDDERREYERKIDELTRTNEKCNQYIAKREHEHRYRDRNEEIKRKHNDEMQRLYDQVRQWTCVEIIGLPFALKIAKQNQQQINLIDEHQKQIEQLKNTYDQRYRLLLDEWKVYNENLHDSNVKLKSKMKEYERTIVQLRYQIINLQIEYLQNGGNANKIISVTADVK